MRARVLLLLTLFAAVSAAGQTGSPGNPLPTSDRGFKPDQVYQFNGFDTVSLFTGNLNLALPLATYTVSSDVSYSFVLRFSGNVWEHYWDCPPPSFLVDDPPPCELKWRPVIGNAGNAWTIDFGELRPAHSLYYEQAPRGAFKYVSPDGAEHLFFETLHEPKCSSQFPTNCDPIQAGVWYTRDGTFIRLKDYPGYVVLEFPDGQRQRHTKYGDQYVGGYTLEYIYGVSSQLDASGIPQTNWVKFESVSGARKVTDSHGRSHYLYSRTDGQYGVDRVEVTKPGPVDQDSETTATYAVYDLVYNAWNGGTTNGSPDPVPWPCDPNHNTWSALNLLSGVILPGGEEYRFEYNRTNCQGSATLTRAILPTGGQLNWSYQSFHTSYDHVGESQAVKERCMRVDPPTNMQPCSATDTSANQLQYMTYAQVSGTTQVKTWARRSNAQWGADSYTVNYFAGIGGPFVALPFNPSVTDGTTVQRNLSTETYDCDHEANTCPTTPERRNYVKYEMDWVGNASQGCHIDYPCIRERNRRVLSERTVFVTDGSRYANTNYSQYDGLGHYRKTNTEGNFASGNTRETYTGYNLTSRAVDPATGIGTDVGIYALTSSGTRATGHYGLLPSDPWFIDNYTWAHVRETGTATTSSYHEACFDPFTGFLKRKRTMRLDNDGWPNELDVLHVYTRDADTGYPASEKVYGGDFQSLNTTELCSVTLPTVPVSHTDHTYQYGVLKTSKFSGVNWFSVNNEVIDRFTGLVLKSTDPAGESTVFSYDDRRRLTGVAPPGVAATTYTYNRFISPSTDANVTAITGTGDLSIQQKWVFDRFGRISFEKKLMPDNSWSVTKMTYDSVGRRESVSEAETESSPGDFTKKTTYGNYDVFGRAGSITTADGKTTTMTYAGDRLTTRTYNVATVDGDVNVSVQEERDRAGRLIKVTENSGGSSPVVTDYTYDEGNRLATVKVWDGTTPQTRTFEYDGRGFLTSEQHPESGTTTYQYDGRGLIINKTTPVATLTHTYDAAGRLKSVNQNGVGDLKFFNYDRANNNATADKSMGKLDYATRYNRSTELGTVPVTETFYYSEAGGRLSKKVTTVAKPGDTVTFTDHYDYNALGDLASITYPVCTSGTCSTATPARTVTTTYKHGLVTEVPGYTVPNGITYHPNGFVATIRHKNVGSNTGPLQTYTLANRMGRVDSIKVENFCDGSNLSVGAPYPQPRAVPYNTAAGISVSATNATSYQWYRVLSDGTNQFLSGQNSATLSWLVTETSTFFVRVGNGSCTVDSARATVSVQSCSNPPSSTITAPTSAGASTGLYPSVPDTPGATYFWTVTNGYILGQSQNSRTPTIGVACSGTLTLNVTVTANGCSSSSTHSVTINPPTVSVSANPTTITEGNSTLLTATFTGAQPSWTMSWSDMPNTQYTVNNSWTWSRGFFPTETAIYSANAVDHNGCQATVLNSVLITVQACTKPSSVISAPTAALSGDLVYASVPDTPGATYQWSVNGNGVITGNSQNSRRASIGASGCSGTLSISVTVTKNGCSSTSTHNVTIQPPSVVVTADPTSIIEGQSATITASITGFGGTITWADLPNNPITLYQYKSTSRSVTPSQNTTYSATYADQNGCSGGSSSALLTVLPPAPTSVSATAIATTQVRVTWNFFGSSADSFRIYRAGTWVGTRTMPATYEFVDTGAEASKSYLYTVVAIKNGQPSAHSAPDLATTVIFTDDPLVAGQTIIKAVHLTQLHTAVNAVRTAAGLTQYSFTAVAPGQLVTAARIEEIRNALAPARQGLNLPAASYTRSPLAVGMVVFSTDISDTRNGVK